MHDGVSGTRTRDPLRARLSDLTLQDEHRLGRRLQRLKRGDEQGRERLERDIERALERVERRRAAVPAVSYPESLPVSARHDDLLAAIRDHQVVVVAGETGSGKTTQLPKICLELGRGVRGTIAHTQPRRLAARTVAERIADELNVPLGEAVGFAVRFSDRSRADTLLRLMTDGLLLAEIQRDRLLRRYDTIIIDEAHERSLNIDFLLGYLKRILPARPDLKVIVTSATIDPERFAAHFGDAPIVEVSGRTYPVEVRYRSPTRTTSTRPTRSATPSRSCCASGPATSSSSSAASARSATPPTRWRGGCGPGSRSCRCSRASRRPRSSACGSRTPTAAWCWPRTSPRPR